MQSDYFNFSTHMPKVILASRSIARKELLQSLGCEVLQYITDADETISDETNPLQVEMLARRKLEKALSEIPQPHNLPIVAADTLLYFNNRLYGKADSVQMAYHFLQTFSGNTHYIYSGFAIYLPTTPSTIVSDYDRASVTFLHIDNQMLKQYLLTDEWKGAAGAYRLQGAANVCIDHIDGDPATVVGLPIRKISGILSSLMCN